MHVRNKHTDKFEEFKKNFDELKKAAVVKDSATRTEVKNGPEPPKIEDKEKLPETKASPKIKDGDGEPRKGGSFLDDFNKWLDSPEL